MTRCVVVNENGNGGPYKQCILDDGHLSGHKFDTYSHYIKDVSHLKKLDVYRVLELFEVRNPAVQHAIKKLLVAGGRGSKDVVKDIDEAIVSLQRWQEMRVEDET